MRKSVLIVAAHPDDEVLGCGGTIHRLSCEGNAVNILILAEGLTSRQIERQPDQLNEELISLHAIAHKVAHVLKANSVELKGLPDNRMDGMELLDIVKTIEEYARLVDADIVFTHNPGDLNIDHRLTAEAVITAFRPRPEQKVKEIYFFEVASSTEWRMGGGFEGFHPNMFMALSTEDLEKKQAALELYEEEMRPFPHARSVEAVVHLARWRGATIGNKAAEAFVAHRVVHS